MVSTQANIGENPRSRVCVFAKPVYELLDSA